LLINRYGCHPFTQGGVFRHVGQLTSKPKFRPWYVVIMFYVIYLPSNFLVYALQTWSFRPLHLSLIALIIYAFYDRTCHDTTWNTNLQTYLFAFPPPFALWCSLSWFIVITNAASSKQLLYSRHSKNIGFRNIYLAIAEMIGGKKCNNLTSSLGTILYYDTC